MRLRRHLHRMHLYKGDQDDSSILRARAACRGRDARRACHHSVAGQFDTAKVVSFSGVVTQVDWINPHSYLHVDVKDKKGEVTSWRIESLPVAMMRKAGTLEGGAARQRRDREVRGASGARRHAAPRLHDPHDLRGRAQLPVQSRSERHRHRRLSSGRNTMHHAHRAWLFLVPESSRAAARWPRHPPATPRTYSTAPGTTAAASTSCSRRRQRTALSVCPAARLRRARPPLPVPRLQHRRRARPRTGRSTSPSSRRRSPTSPSARSRRTACCAVMRPVCRASGRPTRSCRVRRKTVFLYEDVLRTVLPRHHHGWPPAPQGPARNAAGRRGRALGWRNLRGRHAQPERRHVADRQRCIPHHGCRSDRAYPHRRRHHDLGTPRSTIPRCSRSRGRCARARPRARRTACPRKCPASSRT